MSRSSDRVENRFGGGVRLARIETLTAAQSFKGHHRQAYTMGDVPVRWHSTDAGRCCPLYGRLIVPALESSKRSSLRPVFHLDCVCSKADYTAVGYAPLTKAVGRRNDETAPSMCHVVGPKNKLPATLGDVFGDTTDINDRPPARDTARSSAARSRRIPWMPFRMLKTRPSVSRNLVRSIPIRTSSAISQSVGPSRLWPSDDAALCDDGPPIGLRGGSGRSLPTPVPNGCLVTALHCGFT